MKESEYSLSLSLSPFFRRFATDEHCYSLTENCRSSKRISAAERKLSIAMALLHGSPPNPTPYTIVSQSQSQSQCTGSSSGRVNGKVLLVHHLGRKTLSAKVKTTNNSEEQRRPKERKNQEEGERVRSKRSHNAAAAGQITTGHETKAFSMARKENFSSQHNHCHGH